MIKVGVREEVRITTARFQSGLNYKIRNIFELLAYNDLNEFGLV